MVNKEMLKRLEMVGNIGNVGNVRLNSISRVTSELEIAS